jgi:hypothetical protein
MSECTSWVCGLGSIEGNHAQRGQCDPQEKLIMDTTANSGRLERREAPPLPNKIEEWQRILKAERTLNDLVEDIHRLMVNDNEQGAHYRALLRAVYDEQAVEGSCSFDNYAASLLIRERAKAIGSEELAGEKPATISKALNIVMRRYKSSRKQRRDMLEGKIVPDGDNGE